MTKQIFTISLLFIGLALFSQSPIIKEIRTDESLVSTGYYLYPSTLRMINLQRDPGFDKLIKPIKKMAFISLKSDKFDREKLKSISNQLIKEEGCDSYVEMDGPTTTLYVVGDDRKEYTCILAYNDEEYYLAEISGKIDLMQLSKLYEQIQTRDSTSTNNGFLDIFDMMSTNDIQIRKREERNRQGIEQREKREAEAQIMADSIRRDSLQAIENLNITEKPE